MKSGETVGLVAGVLDALAIIIGGAKRIGNLEARLATAEKRIEQLEGRASPVSLAGNTRVSGTFALSYWSSGKGRVSRIRTY